MVIFTGGSSGGGGSVDVDVAVLLGHGLHVELAGPVLARADVGAGGHARHGHVGGLPAALELDGHGVSSVVVGSEGFSAGRGVGVAGPLPVHGGGPLGGALVLQA